jgi:CDP-paratose synthetase
MPTILLTGATGFLGSHLLQALLAKGYKVVVLKRSTSDIWRIKHLFNQVVSYDVDLQPLELPFEQQPIDIVIHTACHYGRNGSDLNEIVETNLMFGLRLLDLSLVYNTGTFINTDTLLNKKLNVYSLSKGQFVEWLKQSSNKIRVINLKLEHMYGGKDDIAKLAPWVLSQLKADQTEIKLTKGDQARDFIYIDDVVHAYVIILERLQDLTDYNEFDVGTGDLITVRRFIEKLKKAYQVEFGISDTKLNFGIIPYREGEMMTVELNNQPLIDLGWSVNTHLEDGLKKVVRESNETSK